MLKKRSLKILLLLMLVTTSLLVANTQQVNATGESGTVDPAITKLLTSGKSVEVVINIYDVPKPTAVPTIKDPLNTKGIDQLAASVSAAKTTVLSKLKTSNNLKQYKYIPTVNAKLNNVAELNSVLSAGRNISITLPEKYVVMGDAQSLPLVKNSPSLNNGRNGAGTEIAVIDGVTSNADHGQNVSAIVKDVAPGANVVLYDMNNLTSAVDTIISRKQSGVNVVAVNLSIGTDQTYAPGTCSPVPYIESLVNANIVPVVAAGNGSSSSGISSPGCALGAVSVGAAYDSNVGTMSYSAIRSLPACTDTTTAALKVTCFSNSSSELDIWAPGAIISAGGYNMAGTSQATPHVAGAIGLMKQGVPYANVANVTQALTNTGTIINARGLAKRFLDIPAATAFLYNNTPIPPVAPSLSTGFMAADFNVDGRVDILARDGSNNLQFFKNIPDASLAAKFRLGAAAQTDAGWSGMSDFMAGNFDVASSDNRPDVLVKNPNNDLIFYKNASNTSTTFAFRPGGTTVDSNWSGFSGFMAADFDVDGRPDVLVKNINNNMMFYKNAGNVNVGASNSKFAFRQATSTYLGNGFYSTTPGAVQVDANWSGFNAYLAGNFDGDNRPDVIVRNATSGQLIFYRNDSNSMWGFNFRPGGTTIGEGWLEYTALIAGDFDNDGRTDIVGRNANNQLLFFKNAVNFGSGIVLNPGIVIGNGWQGYN